MQIHTLKNGMTLIVRRLKTKTAALQVSVHVGSDDETPALNGMSHFVEHMVFEGTKKRDADAIANEVERLGGEFNAVTSNERTYYYIKVLEKHLPTAAEILSDILINPTFDGKRFAKEKKVILEEINMVEDDPRYFQWILLNQHLFQNHPAKYPVYGSVEKVSAMSRQQMLEFYRKQYVPENITLVATGNIESKDIAMIKKKFCSMKGAVPEKRGTFEEPPTSSFYKEYRKEVKQTYMIRGFKTVGRSHQDSYALDVIKAILSRGQSGSLFREIRAKRGLVYEVGASYDPNLGYGIFGIYLSAKKSNIALTKQLIDAELKKLLVVPKNELEDAKSYIEGQFLMENEDTKNLATTIASWQRLSSLTRLQRYLKDLKAVTAKEIQRVAGKYLLNESCTVLICPKIP